MRSSRPFRTPIRRAGWSGRARVAAVVACSPRPRPSRSGRCRTHGFLNWDDPDLLIDNASLQQPAGPLVRWAWTTRHMGHYQPLSWLVFAVGSGTPPSASRVHTIALAFHVLNAALLCWLIAALLDRGDRNASRWWAALGAAAVFALHPLRVEPVAWASALPYLLSSAPLLGSLLCWMAWARTGAERARWSSVGLFAASQLARVTAPLLPLALVVLTPAIPGAIARPLAGADPRHRPLWRCGRAPGPARGERAPDRVARRHRPRAAARVDADPSSAIRVAHARSRHAESARSAAAAARRRLDAGGVGRPGHHRRPGSHHGACGRGRRPPPSGAPTGLLLAPVVGLVPSGLQVTADRYTYGPAMVLSAALARSFSAPGDRGPSSSRWRSPARQQAFLRSRLGCSSPTGAIRSRCGRGRWRSTPTTTWRSTTSHSRRSSRAATTRPSTTSTRLVALVPDHALGKTRLDALVADRELRAAEASAAAGRLGEAIAAFDRALARDPGTNPRPPGPRHGRFAIGGRGSRRRRPGNRRARR